MSHHLSHIPNKHDPEIEKLLEESQSLALRMLASSDAIRDIGPDLITQQIQRGYLPGIKDDVVLPEGNALLMLLSSYVHLIDMRGMLKEGNQRTLSEDIEDLARALVDAGAQPLMASPRMAGVDALDYAFACNAPGLLSEWLGLHPWQDRTISGLPWLHLAAMGGRLQLLDILKDHQGDLNQQDKEGNTPLFYAGTPSTVRWLIQHGADKTHTNAQGLDASVYWQRGKRQTGQAMKEMIGALGRRPAPASSEAAIAQFLELSKTAPVGKLFEEVDRLGIKGDEIGARGGILRFALERTAPHLNARRTKMAITSATSWLTSVTKWEEPMTAASAEDLGLLAVIGQVSDPSIGEQYIKAAHAALNARGEDIRIAELSGIAQLLSLRNENGVDLIKLHHTQLYILIKKLCESPGFMETEGPSLTQIISRMPADPPCPGLMPMIPLIKQEAPEAQGWSTPGFLASLVRMGVGRCDENGDGIFDTDDMELQDAVFELAKTAMEQGARWDGACDEAVKTGRSAAYREAEIAGLFKHALLTNTQPAAQSHRKPGRL